MLPSLLLMATNLFYGVTDNHAVRAVKPTAFTDSNTFNFISATISFPVSLEVLEEPGIHATQTSLQLALSLCL